MAVTFERESTRSTAGARSRAHKLSNVLDYLPKEQRDQVKSVLRAARKLDEKAGKAHMGKLTEWLDRDYPSAATSLLESLERCFIINRLGVSQTLCRCLATTDISVEMLATTPRDFVRADPA